MPRATDQSDTIRILVSTDNHVGFEERDPIRKDDSWRSFEEVMKLARKQDVDMILLAGDLFHDNKPSRKAMFQVMRALRKNCLGMRPCELEFLSDAADVFEGPFPHVNYQDPDINISIPVFSIHGNHDDPTGDGHYCSLDLLQVAGLVNYFGRVPENDNIHVKPILLQKGKTKLALYGLSNVRDERMHRTFRDHKVHFYRPNQQKADFFNILALHQNHHAHSATGYLAENMLPDFMDLVVWGHEHECLIDPRKNPETGFHVMQPGSSVATSLIAGEAVQKQVAIVSITGRDFQVEKIPLRTVRPMVTREVVLAIDKRFKGLEKKKNNRQDITKCLVTTVDEMIVEANEQWEALQEDRQGQGDEEDAEEGQDPPLPLIRLKVEYTALDGGNFEVENPQRFSNRFIGKVANTNDVVYFYRKKATVSKIAKASINIPHEALEAIEAAASGKDVIQVEAIVREYFAAQSLRLLPQAPFCDAVSQYVNKADKERMQDFVFTELANQVKELLAMDEDEAGPDLDAGIERIRKRAEEAFLAGVNSTSRTRRLKPKPDGWDSDLDGNWVNDTNAWEEVDVSLAVSSCGRKPQDKAGSSRGKARNKADTDENLDDDAVMERDEPEEWPAAQCAPAKRGDPAKATTTKRAPAKKTATAAMKPPARGQRTAGPFIDDSEEEEDVVMENDDFEVIPAPKKTAAAARQARSTRAAAPVGKRQTTLNFSQSQRSRATQPGRSAQSALELSDDEIDEEDAFEAMPPKRASRKR